MIYGPNCKQMLDTAVYSKRQMSPPPGLRGREQQLQDHDPVWIFAFGAWRQGGVVSAPAGLTMTSVEYVRSQTGTLATRKFHNREIIHRTV